MTDPTSCESCGMPLETGRYCTHCTTDSGRLQPFEERFARMVAWQERRNPTSRGRTPRRPRWPTSPPCPPGVTTRG
jgi:hypothetical protein